MSRKIIFIGHESGRTGAPIVLLSFLRWFKHETDIPFQIILRDKGELEPEFRALAPVFVIGRQEELSGISMKRALRGSTRRLGLAPALARVNHAALARRFPTGEIGLVYSNTATNGMILDELSYLHCPAITHIHELGPTLLRGYGAETFQLVKKNTSHYIAVSDAVKTSLTNDQAIPSEQIDVIHAFIDVGHQPQVDTDAARTQTRNQLGIPREAFVVGGAGAAGWLKGTDLFIQLASAVNRKGVSPSAHFVWVGSPPPDAQFSEIQQEVRQAGLEPFVHFTGTVTNPMDYFSAFDLLALTSREDSFPLVMLESASLGKPIICFEGSGGAPEFVENDCGVVVPHLNVGAFAERVKELMMSPSLRRKLGKRAEEKVRERHDISVAGPKILEVIKRSYVG
jgi:glycosyltransferase involved in cell wall biosynthesis